MSSSLPRPEDLQVLAEFAAGAGHEINNPLATILGRTDILLRRLDRISPSGEVAEARRDLQVIAGQTLRIREMIGDLMLIARPPVPRLQVCDLKSIASQTVDRLTREATQAGLCLNLTPISPVLIQADPNQVQIVLSELIRNSLDATEAGGTIQISISQATADTGGGPMVRLTVCDTGRGLTELEEAHLLAPFFSGRSAGRGLGFGLCKVARILEQHGGSLAVRNRTPHGVEFTTLWPAQISESSTEFLAEQD